MNNLYTALAQFQARACVLGKDSRGHGYDYASFDRILTQTRRALLECGLVVVQPVECDGGSQHIKTIVCHAESGEQIVSTYALDLVQLKAANNAQQMGAAISYARRYAFLAALGLAAGGEDTDAAEIAPKSEEETAQEKLQAMSKEACRELGATLRDIDPDGAKAIADKNKIPGGYDYVAMQADLEKALDAIDKEAGVGA